MHTITPHLVCANAANAISFYARAFGAAEISRLLDSSGQIMHAALRIGDSTIMLNDEFAHCGQVGPQTLKGTPVTLHMYVADVDAAFKRATDAGAVIVMPLTDMFWGDRYGVVTDPGGHQWSLATHMREVSIEEMHAAMKDMESVQTKQ